VESATVAWTRLFYSFAASKVEAQTPGVIYVTTAEYAANVVAACQWARTNEGWSVECIPSVNGVVDLKAFQALLLSSSSSTAIVCATHIPTNSGIVNPVQEMGCMIADYNKNQNQNSIESNHKILYLVDACQAIGQLPINVQDMQCHGLAGTGRKYLRGPRGTGFLYTNIANDIFPNHIDHAGVPIRSVLPKENMQGPIQDLVDYQPRPGAKRFEFWESNLATKLGLGVAIRHALEIGIDTIETEIQTLSTRLYQNLLSMERVHVHYKPNCGLVTFWVDGMDAAQVKAKLAKPERDEQVAFEVSVVPATSTPLDAAPELVRASVSYTNSMDEVDLFCNRLSNLLKLESSS
jgi:cysteine desulfurase/selenocysteine lyase